MNLIKVVTLPNNVKTRKRVYQCFQKSYMSFIFKIKCRNSNYLQLWILILPRIVKSKREKVKKEKVSVLSKLFYVNIGHLLTLWFVDQVPAIVSNYPKLLLSIAVSCLKL